MMNCPICNHTIEKLIDFQPYIDMEWVFPMYQCSHCGTRMVERDKNINYHEFLYDKYNAGSYGFYFDIAKKVRDLLNGGQVEECERYLRLSSKYSKIFDFVYQNATSESRIVEVGCSTGFITAFLRSRGFNVEGIDISQTSIHLARDYFGEFYHLIDDCKINKADIIIHCGMIGCVDDPREFLRHYLNLLTDQGKMYFNAPYNRADMLKEIWCSTPPPDLGYLYSEKSFSFLIDENSYSISREIEYEENTLLIYLRKIFGVKRVSYPKHFMVDVNNRKGMPGVSGLKKNLKIVLKIVEKLFQGLLLTRFPKEYGMYITLEKK